MSAKLAMRVWESALEPRLKPTAVALALFAADDGGRIYPSVDRLAWLIGKTSRQVRDNLADLRTLGVLVPETRMRVDAYTGALVPVGGRSAPTRYRLERSALPSREPFLGTRNPEAGVRVSDTEKGDADVRVSYLNPEAGVRVSRGSPGSPPAERVKFSTETLKPTSINPEVGFTRSVSDQSVDQSVRSTAAAPRLADDEHPPTTEKKFAALSREPADDGNFHVLVKLAHTVMDETGESHETPDLIEAVKVRSAKARIDYGRDPLVRHDVVQRAIACACGQRIARRVK